jgi:hypothetical protein
MEEMPVPEWPLVGCWRLPGGFPGSWRKIPGSLENSRFWRLWRFGCKQLIQNADSTRSMAVSGESKIIPGYFPGSREIAPGSGA